MITTLRTNLSWGNSQEELHYPLVDPFKDLVHINSIAESEYFKIEPMFEELKIILWSGICSPVRIKLREMYDN